MLVLPRIRGSSAPHLQGRTMCFLIFWIFPGINNSLKFSRFVLSCGKDSTVKLWEVGTGRLVKQYTGAVHTQLRCQVSELAFRFFCFSFLKDNQTTSFLLLLVALQAVFNESEDFIISVDESSNEVWLHFFVLNLLKFKIAYYFANSNHNAGCGLGYTYSRESVPVAVQSHRRTTLARALSD